MQDTIWDKMIQASKMQVAARSDTSCRFQMRDAWGEGQMTCYEIFKGIILMKNDFHMAFCQSEFQMAGKMLAIDHCREGRIEWALQNNHYTYLSQGDLQIGSKNDHAMGFGFPTQHYHGITVAIFYEEISPETKDICEVFGLDLEAFYKKYGGEKNNSILRNQPQVDHILSEIYHMAPSLQVSYYRLKVIELLLYLLNLEKPINGQASAYFPKQKVEQIKAIHTFLTSHLNEHLTVEALSERFDMPQTQMKTIFKAVYGEAIYQFTKRYKMEWAAKLLRESDAQISEIAGQVGYDNPSKFSAAFKKEWGVTPLHYRQGYL